MIEVLLHNEPYRYIEMPELLDNGKILDPAGVPCYIKEEN